MNKRFFAMLAVFAGLMTFLAQAGLPAQAKEPSVRKVVWRALQLALEARGLVITNTSQGKKRMISSFHRLEPSTLPQIADLSRNDREKDWAGAEYRYQIDIGSRKGRPGSIFIRAEIRAWDTTADQSKAAAGVPIKQVLKSRKKLEKELLRGLGHTLAAAHGELAQQ